MKYISYIGIAFVIIIMVSVSFNAVDNAFDRQDTMLCNSAKVSGNNEYLNKCKCFYKGENIRCIYE